MPVVALGSDQISHEWQPKQNILNPMYYRLYQNNNLDPMF